MAEVAFSLASWSILPPLATYALQRAYYTLSPTSAAPPNSFLYYSHQRRIQILVICIYLMYDTLGTFLTALRTPTLYTILHVPLSATERDLKSAFRRLALLQHPDKLPSADAPIDPTNDGANFLALKLAYDTLLSPIKRFAYDRFGPQILEWRHCATQWEFVKTGFTQTIAPYYGVMVGFQALFQIVGIVGHSHLWRYLITATFCCWEALAVTRGERFVWPVGLWNAVVKAVGLGRWEVLPFEAIAVGRKVLIVFFIALNQLKPLMDAEYPDWIQGGRKRVGGDSIDRLLALAQKNELDVNGLLQQESKPLLGDEDTREMLKEQIRDVLVEETIKNDPSVRNAFALALAAKGHPP